MKYESDIAETIHETALAGYRLGVVSEAEMREYDELCLTQEALQDKTAHDNSSHENVNIKHAELATA